MTNRQLENFKLIFLLKKVDSLGDVKIRRIVEKLSSIEKIQNSDPHILQSIEGISDKLCFEIEKVLNNIGRFSEEFVKQLEMMKSNNVNVITILDENYPTNLKNIYDAPVLLYYIGQLQESDRYSIAIVGTRTPSDYGRKVCLDITKALTNKGIPVISGLAIGIDSIAHNACLDEGGLTYAILGSGVLNLYPPDNKILYDKIKDRGAVISEFDIFSKAEKVNFPRRNRVVSGISLGTLIVESREKGGSLITADFALDQNRELFAVPGNINSKNSLGCNNLIKNGYAKLVTNVDDLLCELNTKISDVVNYEKKLTYKNEPKDLNVFENIIYNVLNDVEPINIDKISELTELNISDCLVNLLTMEFKGVVSQLPGKYFIKS